jgi:hypothetical protein
MNHLLYFQKLSVAAIGVLAGAFAADASAALLTVGPSKTFSTPCRAFANAVDGDTIEIDAAGMYAGDVCGISRSRLTIRGVNGRPKIDANGQNALGKGTWVLMGNGTVIDNIELSGSKVADRNGAALRLEGRDLTLRNSYVHHNENGILTNSDTLSNVVIENTEFASNGYGDGYSHNLYVGHINSLTFTGSYSHDANIGHNLKSRANTNTITYSRFSSSSGQPSYEIDLPNAGLAYIIGNVIQQPSTNQNPTMVAFGEEGATNTGQSLYVVNNTFLNDDSSHGTFIFVGNGVTTPALVQNNIFVGTGTAITQAAATDRTNYRTLSPAFVDRANFDLHPAAGSPAINGGSVVGASASGSSLSPTMQYHHTAAIEARAIDSQIDIGAYEVATSSTDTTTASTPIWTACAKESGLCAFGGTHKVRYGANNQYAYQTATSSITCNNATFGDPIKGVAKSCDYDSSTAAPVVVTWVTCASENGSCSFTGTRQVRYGASGVYAFRTVTNTIACNNATFGDPIVNVVKTCSYAN